MVELTIPVGYITTIKGPDGTEFHILPTVSLTQAMLQVEPIGRMIAAGELGPEGYPLPEEDLMAKVSLVLSEGW